ncbi:hypothetical protein GCM10010909_17210 [Acidocella aquatica]|uniref:Endonuclease NucS C-terminal domain-containing protein n=1 Tax=Acidocella aquatica TaxID=1922313 RepID=A0ABQ6AAE3_9PROT|nr:endonuclease NucS domain-containing protein [Acidocella aquatica]GLR67040.1 hypothetical protein GCM10010909_17210 [Acidocella aquatica]
MKKFNIAISNEDGSVTLAPMKEWLRNNPQYIPEGLDGLHSTSHELRNGLKKRGWLVHETDTEVHLVKPGSQIEVENVLGDSESELNEQSQLGVAAFELEAHLRDFLSHNLAMINVEGKRVRLYVDPTGRDGVEYPTATGPIDILAVSEQGDFYIFELKRALSPNSAIGQLARYMGWVKQTIGKGKNVFGVIVAKSINDRLRYAISVVPNVSLFEYEVQFRLNPANEFDRKG